MMAANSTSSEKHHQAHNPEKVPMEVEGTDYAAQVSLKYVLAE